MSLTGQGLASGFTGGFKMMDDYYNRQKTQKLNQQTADNAQKTFENQETVFKQNQKKIRVEEALKGIAGQIDAGQLPSQDFLDVLQTDLNYDLYHHLDPKVKEAQQDILNQKYNLQSPEFTNAVNLVWGGMLNKNNSEVPFETMGRVPDKRKGIEGVYTNTPEKIKGNKILNKKLIGGAYAMGGGVVGGDLEVMYEDAEGNVKTYLAPMTQGAGTAGDGDNVAGQNVDGLLSNLKGTMMLTDGMEPLMKNIRQLMKTQGVETPMSSVDTNMISTYTSLGTKHMTMAQSAMAQMYPNASSGEMAAILASAANKDAPKTVISGGVSQPVNIQAWNAYQTNMAKAQKYFGAIDNIYIKYNGEDYQSLSGIEGMQAQATGGFVNDAVNSLVANQTDSNSADTATETATTNQTVTTNTDIPVRPEAAPDLNAVVTQQAQSAREQASGYQGQSSSSPEMRGLGLTNEEITPPLKVNPDQFRMFEAFPTNSNAAVVNASPNGLQILPTQRPSNMDSVDMVTDNANAIVTMAKNGTLKEWLSSDPENQRIADNTALHLDMTREQTGAYEQGAGDRLKTLISNHGLAIDDPRHYKYEEWQANNQASIAADNQASTNDEIDYNRAGAIEAEITDMRAAISDPNMMALVRREAARDPSHINSVEQMLTRIQSLPRNQKTAKQWEDVFEYWMEVNGPQNMTPSQKPNILDRWKMAWGFGPSMFDQYDQTAIIGLSEQINAYADQGTLKEFVDDMPSLRMSVIRDIYKSLNTRKAPAAVIKRFEASVNKFLN